MMGEEMNNKLRDIKKKRYQVHSQQKASFKKLFDSNIDINFKDTQIISMIVRGIPSIYRSVIWPKLIENVHGITLNFYQILIKKATLYLNTKEIDVSPDRQRMVRQLKMIEQDIERTFPDLKVFRKDSDQGQYLFNMLTSWTVFREDIGYMQGMSQIAGMLLLQLKQTDAFPIFCSMITSDILFAYYTMDTEEMKKIQENFQYRIRRGDEDLYSRLKELKIEIRIFMLSWIMTLFTRVMDLDLVGRLWDIILSNDLSEKVIIEICYYLLIVFKNRIMDKDLEVDDIMMMLKSQKVNEIEAEEMFENIRNALYN